MRERQGANGWIAVTAIALAAVVVLAIAGGSLADAARWLGERYFWPTNLLMAIGFAALIGAILAVGRGLAVAMGTAVVALACLVLPFYIPFYDGHTKTGPELESRYCSYSAASDPEYDACLDSVSVSADIDGSEANPARFARGEISCGLDASPLCASAGDARDR